MLSYAVKLAGAAILLLIAGVVAVLIFSALWFRIGFGIAIVVLAGGLLYAAWRSDRKARQARAGLERV